MSRDGNLRSIPTLSSRSRQIVIRVVIVLLLVLLGGGIGAGGFSSPSYRASAYAAVTARAEFGLQRENHLARTWAAIARSHAVVQATAAELGVSHQDLAAALDVDVSPDAPMVEVAVTVDDPAAAAWLANGVMNTVTEQAAAHVDDTGADLVVLADAVTSTRPVSPSIGSATLGGGAVGLVLAALVLLGRRPATAPLATNGHHTAFRLPPAFASTSDERLAR